MPCFGGKVATSRGAIRSRAVEGVMTKLISVPVDFAQRARITAGQYKLDYRALGRRPGAFWGDVARRIDWIRPWTQVKDVSFDPADFRIRWFADGELNVSANCLDRHLATRGDKTAIIWEGDDPARVAPHHLPRAARRRSAASPTCSRPRACARATASPSTCR